MKNRLNFAPKPFLFRDRKVYALWLLNLAALGLLGFLGWSWWHLRSKNEAAHASLRDLQRQQTEHVERHGDILKQLGSVDLRDYRRQMRLFQGIQTAFSTQWGPLLDQIGSMLPEDVRMLELKPTQGTRRSSDDTVIIQMRGEARTKKAELAFLEALDQAPNFSDVAFESENYEKPDVAVTFEIQFTYRPEGMN